MKCRYCDHTKPLIEAHIIPEPFFKVYGASGHFPKLLSNTQGSHPKRLPTGFYDSKILCAACDTELGVWDQYGVTVLISELDILKPFRPFTGFAYVRDSYDYARLKLFFLSVLWRAAVSTLAAFSRVSLGPYARRIRDMLQTGSPGASHELTTLLSVFTLDGTIWRQTPLMDPFAETWNGVKAYRLSFGAVQAYIKVDSRPFPNAFETLALHAGQPLCILGRDFRTSSEAQAMRAIAKTPQNRRAFQPRKAK